MVPEMQKSSFLQENYEQFGDQTGGVLEGNPPQEKHRGSKLHTIGRYHVSTFCSDFSCTTPVVIPLTVLLCYSCCVNAVILVSTCLQEATRSKLGAV